MIKSKKKGYERTAVAYKLNTKKVTRFKHLEEAMEECFEAIASHLEKKGYFNHYCLSPNDIRITIEDNTLKCYYDYPALEETKAEN